MQKALNALENKGKDKRPLEAGGEDPILAKRRKIGEQAAAEQAEKKTSEASKAAPMDTDAAAGATAEDGAAAEDGADGAGAKAPMDTDAQAS